MSRLVDFGLRRAPHIAVLALVSVAFGGCSADTSTRFSSDNFSNPFASRGAPETTGSVPHGQYQTRELPQYARPATAPVVSAPLSQPSQPAMSGGGRGMSSYAPPSRPIETTASVPPRSVAATPSGWTREGGTKIIVGTSDTLEIISRRYNVPASAILQANGYHGPRALSPGQSLIIPRQQSAAARVQPPALSPAPTTKSAAGLPASVHVVNRGDTLNNIARRNHVSVAQLAQANNLPVTAQLKLGSKINVPASGAVPAAPAVAAAPAIAPTPAKPVVTAAAEPVQKEKARLATETKDIEAAPSPVKAAEATNALPTFRWPVRGRVITAYGAKANGKQNDGINVAVPEGTPVKAAEDGVVAYSGNELKGYGNLVLVRHSNGYVTAYAHASELMVKRGDTIKRGQVIAKSGQSGEVGSPQLHFEIRKGSSPVDPLQFLNGA